MNLRERITNLEEIKSEMLEKKYGKNIRDLEFGEKVLTGIVDPLLNAIDNGEKYCVVLGKMVPEERNWDPNGNGDWNPVRDYITTDDIATEDNDREKEKDNIYSFLRGEQKEKRSGRLR